jgi:hypothetical protein
LLLKVVQKDTKGTSLFTKLGDNSARSTNGLLHTAIVIKLGKSTPCSKVLSGLNHNNVNLAFGAKTLDELLVFLILAILGKTAETSSSAVQSLGAFVKTFLKSSMDHGLFKDLLSERKKQKLVKGIMFT